MKPTFLVLTDLSPRTQRAVHFAAQLASAVDGQLLILYLEDEYVRKSDLDQAVADETYYRQQLDIDSTLAELARQLPVPTVIENRLGNLYEALSELSSQWQPQLFVLGLAPEHSLADELLVNPELSMLRDSGLPLLLVPENTVREDLGLPQQVAIAADGQAIRLAPAAQRLALLLGYWTDAYCVLHVAAPTDVAGAGMHQAFDTVRHSGLLPTPAICTTYHVRHQTPSFGIVQGALDVQADLLVLLAHPRGPISSLFGCGTIAQVVRTCPIPMLLLPTVDIQQQEPPSTKGLRVKDLI